MKIAVILRGHKRNWEYTKENIISCFQQLPHKVDYYVAVWENNSNLSLMLNDFPKDQLKTFLSTARDQNFTDGPNSGPAYHNRCLMPFIMAEELSSKENYDMIIDTRFDVRISLTDIPLEPVPSLSLGYFSTRVDHMDDHFFIYDRLAFRIFNTRNYFNYNVHVCHSVNIIKSQNIHEYYFDFCKRHGIGTYKISCFIAGIERPIDHFTYVKLSPHEKLTLYRELGLDPDDFENHLTSFFNDHMTNLPIT